MGNDIELMTGKVRTEKELCKTGIEGIDQGLGGGIPLGNAILLAGSSGSGKTILCMQFLTNGAKQGERGIFFTVTEPLFKLTKNMESFSFYDKKLVESGMVNLIDLRIISERLGLDVGKYTTEEASALLDVLHDIVVELNIKRLVIDSITALCYRLQTKDMIRDFIFRLGSLLTSMDCTAIFTSEVPPGKFQYSQYEVEEFISDGIILLGNIERKGDLIRTFQIVKMRGTAHSRIKYAMNISAKNGIEVVPLLKSES